MQVCEQDVLFDDTFIKKTLEVPLESSDKVIEIASKVRRASPSACGWDKHPALRADTLFLSVPADSRICRTTNRCSNCASACWKSRSGDRARTSCSVPPFIVIVVFFFFALQPNARCNAHTLHVCCHPGSLSCCVSLHTIVYYTCRSIPRSCRCTHCTQPRAQRQNPHSFGCTQ